ncbi:MAG: right-handed parallel beta-helix repeat-containing protein [Candidatus Cyclobacteriaceae bacterium M3_2C_046]
MKLEDTIWRGQNDSVLKASWLSQDQGFLWPSAKAMKNITLATLSQPLKVTHLEFQQTFYPGKPLIDWMAAVGLAHRKNQLPPEVPTVITYQVIYQDSSMINIPVRFEESIHNWYRIQTVGPMLWAEPKILHSFDQPAQSQAVVYNMQWPNPKPNVPVTGIRIAGETSEKQAWGEVLLLSIKAYQQSDQGRSFYVDRPPMGWDGGAGTYEQPFGSIQKAVDLARPGDQIYIRGGYYALSEPVNINFTGKEGKWLTISAFFGETPVLEAYGIHYDYRDQQERLKTSAVAPLRQNDTGIISAWGDPSFLRIQGLQIQNSRRAGISVYGKPAQGSGWGVSRQVDVRFNTVYRSHTMGIIIHRVDQVQVIGNRVVRPHSVRMSSDPVTGSLTSFDHGAQEAIDLSRNKGFEIAFNEVYGGGKEAIDCISVEDGEIHHNYVHDCLNGIYIDSWSVPIRRLKIHHNFIHNAFNGIPLATEGSNDLYDFDIHHNIIIDSKSVGIGINEATYKANPAKVQEIRVYQNTIHGSGGHASAIGWQASGIDIGGFKDNQEFKHITVRDNIVTHTTGRPLANVYAGKPAHHIDIVHNLIFPPEDSTPEWIVSKDRRLVDNFSVHGRSARLADPNYKSVQAGDVRIQKKSPAIGAGSKGQDLGALALGQAWVPGLDWSGKITAYYHGPVVWQPLHISPEKFTLHRNHLQRPSWFQRNRYGVDFQNLPHGYQSFTGIIFFIPDESQVVHPTVLALRGRMAEVAKEHIYDIAIGRKADQLAFLQAYHMVDSSQADQGDQLFHYRVNYENGTSVNILVKWLENIGDWLGLPEALGDLPQAQLAYHLKVFQKRNKEQQIRLYSMTWKNPHPELQIKSLDLINDQEYHVGAPAVFGIATGKNRGS